MIKLTTQAHKFMTAYKGRFIICHQYNDCIITEEDLELSIYDGGNVWAAFEYEDDNVEKFRDLLDKHAVSVDCCGIDHPEDVVEWTFKDSSVVSLFYNTDYVWNEKITLKEMLVDKLLTLLIRMGVTI